MKHAWMVMMGLLVASAGCATHQQSKAAAELRWSETRGKVLLSVAEEQFDTGDFDNAKSSASEALAMSPNLVGAHLLLARVAIEQTRYADAEEHLKVAEESRPDDARVAYLLAVVEERREHYPQALKLYEKARALDPKNPACVLASVEVMVRMDRPAEALALIEGKLTSMDPTAGMYVAAGRLATMVGRHDRAAVHYAQARSLLPEDAELQAQLAKAYFFSGQHDLAIRELEMITGQTKEPGPVWMRTMLGESHLAAGQASKAKAVFIDVTRREPRVAHHWANLAKAALESNDLSRASLSSREALAIDPSQADAAVVLGYVLLRQGQGEQAKAMLLGMARTHPENATVLCLLGRSYQVLGQQDRAAKCFGAALALEPNNPVMRRLASVTVDKGP